MKNKCREIFVRLLTNALRQYDKGFRLSKIGKIFLFIFSPVGIPLLIIGNKSINKSADTYNNSLRGLEKKLIQFFGDFVMLATHVKLNKATYQQVASVRYFHMIVRELVSGR